MGSGVVCVSLPTDLHGPALVSHLRTMGEGDRSCDFQT